MSLTVLHVLNYGWPHVDGYTIRSAALITAQQEVLGWTPVVSTSPYPTFAAGSDPEFRTPAWGPERQLHATRHGTDGPVGPRAWERPAIGLAPVTARMYRRELASVMRRSGCDIVHAHHPHQSAGPALAAARAEGLPFVYELRCFNGDYEFTSGAPHRRARGHRVNALEMALARRADRVVTIADGLAARLVAGGVDAGRVHIVRNAVDTARFYPRPQRAPDGIVRLGYATTFAPMENLDGLLRALALLLAERPALRDGLRVTLAGRGAAFAEIEALRGDLGLREIVDLPGFIPYSRMPEMLAGLDLFVVPRGDHAVSRGTTPLKPLEALAIGRPVLATDLPAMRELMGGRPDVRFCPATDRGLADGIASFLDAPWTGTGDIGNRAWSSEVRRYPAIYEAARAAAPRAAASSSAPGRDLRGRFGRLAGMRPPASHVVICGFPRAGSTLLQVMLTTCLPGAVGFDRETRAADMAGKPILRGRILVTERPDDVTDAAAIRAACAAAGTRPLFLLTVRDPDDCLTSTHKAYPGSRGDYLSPDRWARTFDAVAALRSAPDALVVRYEDLVTDPSAIEAAIAERLGAVPRLPFARYHEAAGAGVRDSMTGGALGGLRALDAAGIGRGAAPGHAARRAEVPAALPQLDAMRAMFGYAPAPASPAPAAEERTA